MIRIDMPMPDNCVECRFNVSEFGYCNAMPVEFCGRVNDYEEDGKPEWCPLKVQEPKEMSDAELMDAIRKAPIIVKPAVDAAPVVHARWIEIEDSWGDCHYQCSECGEEWNLDAGTPVENNMNFCPCCGAKMDKEE